MTGRPVSPPSPAAAVSGPPAQPAGLAAAVSACWDRFWFSPADVRPLAVVRIGTAVVAVALWWSFVPDRDAWLSPAGLLPADTVREWRSPAAVSLFDPLASPWAARILFGAVGLTLGALLLGAGTAVIAPAAAVLWATLLNRVPMLAGPADDVVAVLLWCLAIGPCGDHVSFDAWWRGRRAGGRAARPAPAATWRAAVSLGLLDVHASAIAAAAALAQLKGDAWWNGLASWYLASSPRSRLGGIAPAVEASTYLGDLVTHAIVAFEIAMAVGPWCTVARRPLARLGLVAWPLVGLLAGEPWWGAAMAVMVAPAAIGRRTPDEPMTDARPWPRSDA